MSETVLPFSDTLAPAAAPPPTLWVADNPSPPNPPNYWEILSQGIISGFITDGGGSTLGDPLLFNTFGIFSVSYDPATDTFTLNITCRGSGASGNAIKIRMYNLGGYPAGQFTEVEVVSGNSPVGDFGVLWGTATWVSFTRVFPANGLMSTDAEFEIHVESEDAVSTTFEIAKMSLTAEVNNTYTGEGGVEVNSSYINPDITGSGGVEVAGAPQTVLSTDCTGIYTLIVGQHFDRIYSRNTDPAQTDDVKIPDPFGKSGFIGS